MVECCFQIRAKDRDSVKGVCFLLSKYYQNSFNPCISIICLDNYLFMTGKNLVTKLKKKLKGRFVQLSQTENQCHRSFFCAWVYLPAKCWLVNLVGLA